MSSTLTIEPSEREKTGLSDQLKFILRKKYNGCVSQIMVNKYDISYFEALRDSEIKDADLVISFIEKYGSCTISEEF